MSRFFSVPAILTAVGIIGALASISPVTDPTWKTVAFAVSLALLLLAAVIQLGKCCNLASAWRTLTVCKRLGIRAVYGHGELAAVEMSRRIENARAIRMMAITGLGWIRAHEDQIGKAIVQHAADIRMLIAAPDSEFMKNQEAAESDTRQGHGSNETRQVLDLLREYVRDAQAEVGPNRTIGTVMVAFYRTELRNSLVICDNSWGWLTINLPPRRVRQMASVELGTASEALLDDCIAHFEKVWTLSADTIQRIQ